MTSSQYQNGRNSGPTNLRSDNNTPSAAFETAILAQTQAPTTRGPVKSNKSPLWMKLGFQAKYEFTFWALVSSVMTFFVFIRSPYLKFSVFEERSSPGEWYWFRQNPYHTGIFMHLWTTLPAGALAIIQFVPAIRRRAPFVHKSVGFTIMALLTMGNIAIAIVTPISMGGNDLSLSAAVVFLILLTSVAMGLAWYNIRKQQIDQHRKWMLRAMFWMSIIVTMRLVMIVAMMTVTYTGGYKTLWTCDQASFVTNKTEAFYEEFPACRLGPQTYIGVPAELTTRLHIGSAVRLTFSMSTWVAICLHTIGVELYIHLTPKENERLRMISYRKQLALGLVPAGSAGLTADRLGVSNPWTPTTKTA